MENEDENLNIEKEKVIINKKKAPKKKSLFKKYKGIFILLVFSLNFFFFLFFSLKCIKKK